MASPSRTVFKVLNISWTCIREDLRNHFKQYGKIFSIHIPMDYQTGFNRKMAIIEMKEKEGLTEKILQDYHIIDDQEVTVKVDKRHLNSNKTEETDLNLEPQ